MPRADPFRPVPARILRSRRETSDTFTLDLEISSFSFEPGQFNMLYVFGVGEVPISISGDRAKPDALVHTIRAVGTVTKAMQRLKRGATLGLRGPYGSAWPVATAEGADLLLIAGGLGLAPLRPVVYQTIRERERFGRVVLLYGARTPEDLLFRKELERWARSIDVAVTVDRAGPDWTGRVGVVPALLDGLALDPSRTFAMLCGPEIMMRFTVRALADRGAAPERVFVSLERSMKCAVGFCGHCQYGPTFVCKDGPVVPFDRVAPLFDRREI
jgi:NAD(P)H-flavin reductase